MAGLPHAMVVKRELLRKQQAENPTGVVEQPAEVSLPHMDQPTDPPVVTKPTLVVVDPPVEDAPALTLDEQWKIEAKKWEQKFRSLEGIIAGLDPQLKSEKAQREQLELELRQLREALPPPAPVPVPDEDLNEEELQIYGESQNVIAKIARKIARGETKAALTAIQKEIDTLHASQTQVQADLTTTSETQFMSHVKSRIPKFDQIIELQEWKDYIATKAPYSRNTIFDLLSQAHVGRDIDTIVEIFGGFKPSKAALAQMVSPSLAGGAPPVHTNGGQKPMLKISDRKKVSDDFVKGKITKAKLDEWNQLFREAEAENRIDYTR